MQGQLTFGRALGAVRLHGYVGVQVVQRSVRLFATVPAALVHALDFFIASARSLVLLCARDRDKRVDGRERVATLLSG